MNRYKYVKIVKALSSWWKCMFMKKIILFIIIFKSYFFLQIKLKSIIVAGQDSALKELIRIDQQQANRTIITYITISWQFHFFFCFNITTERNRKTSLLNPSDDNKFAYAASSHRRIFAVISVYSHDLDYQIARFVSPATKLQELVGYRCDNANVCWPFRLICVRNLTRNILHNLLIITSAECIL